jgi:hypothetical protein
MKFLKMFAAFAAVLVTTSSALAQTQLHQGDDQGATQGVDVAPSQVGITPEESGSSQGAGHVVESTSTQTGGPLPPNIVIHNHNVIRITNQVGGGGGYQGSAGGRRTSVRTTHRRNRVTGKQVAVPKKVPPKRPVIAGVKGVEDFNFLRLGAWILGILSGLALLKYLFSSNRQPREEGAPAPHRSSYVPGYRT